MSYHITSARRGRYGVRLAVISVGLTGLGIAATAGTSAAHNPTVVSSCTDLSLDLTQYEGPASNNTVTVTIDGTATTIEFAEGLNRSFQWNDAVDHVWSVAIDANRQAGDATGYDSSRSGTQHACVTTTTSAAATTTTTIPLESPTTMAADPTTDTPTTAVPTTVVPTTADPTTAAPTTAAPTTADPTTAASTTTAPTTTGPTTAAAASTTVVAPREALVDRSPTSPAGTVATAAPTGDTLPQTGNSTGLQLALAIVVLLAGVVLITITRRHANTTDQSS